LINEIAPTKWDGGHETALVCSLFLLVILLRKGVQTVHRSPHWKARSKRLYTAPWRSFVSWYVILVITDLKHKPPPAPPQPSESMPKLNRKLEDAGPAIFLSPSEPISKADRVEFSSNRIRGPFFEEYRQKEDMRERDLLAG